MFTSFAHHLEHLEDTIQLFTAGREHDDRPAEVRPDPFAHAVAVQPGQVDVEHNRIRLFLHVLVTEGLLARSACEAGVLVENIRSYYDILTRNEPPLASSSARMDSMAGMSGDMPGLKLKR